MEQSGATERWDDIIAWFEQRGFGVRINRERDDLVWADLTRLPSGRIVAPKYGRGETPLSAAQSAKQRYAVEQ